MARNTLMLKTPTSLPDDSFLLIMSRWNEQVMPLVRLDWKKLEQRDYAALTIECVLVQATSGDRQSAPSKATQSCTYIGNTGGNREYWMY